VIGIIAILVATLLPTLQAANAQSRSVQCLSNLRQMMVAVEMYQQTNAGRFPLSGYSVFAPPTRTSYAWDYTRIININTNETTIEPGLLWWKSAAAKVMQCPVFERTSVGFVSDPATGYNYNTSYLGGEQELGTGIIYAPAKLSQVRKPSQTVVFGDGEYSAGANKFMRSPFPSGREVVSSGRFAGTQGFRHRGASNAAFADGHAAPSSRRFTATLAADQSRITAGTGFLSADNSLYDLE
ncbi:MAG TPA: hypothetical protein PLD59_02960, partial [Tepidisphaeraceae bacterium]|nr:hypothetical protein [Tepidisphaeraceae bacterium]